MADAIPEGRNRGAEERSGQMSMGENKRVVEQGFQRLMNEGELALADDLVSEDFVNHDAPPGAPGGPVGLRQIVTMLRTAFPDLHQQIEEVIAADEMVVVRTTMTGTHTGPFPGAPLRGIPPTGRRFAQQQVHIFRFAGGKAVEHRAVRDDLGMLQQLGVIPIPDPATV
jgi:predicted ester cyclase